MERSRQLELPMPFDCQPVIAEAPPFIPNYQRVLFDYKLGWHSNEIEWVEVKNKIELNALGVLVNTHTPDNTNASGDDPEAGISNYTKQLQFHEQELREAEKRHMPASQVAYHFDRLCLLRKMGVEYV